MARIADERSTMRTRRNDRSCGDWQHDAIAWLPLAILPTIALLGGPLVPRWVWMWALAFSIYAGCKWLTWFAATRPRRSQSSGAARSLGYLLAWPGMDAAAFLDPDRRAAQPRTIEWAWAMVKLVFGVAVVWGLCRVVPDSLQLLSGWVGMIGLIFTLHLGVFHLLSLTWRSWGIDARPIFNWPILTPSLSDFWRGRWNLAFRDLAHALIFKPLAPRWGAIGAMMIVFVISGLVHDLVISVPAGGGYGLPTIYFLIQAAGVMLERSRLGDRLGLRRGVAGRLFAILIAVGPLFWLFHPPFVHEVFVPFLRAVGAM